jgi:glycerol-3-phosphate dehydrogenase
LYFEYRTDDSRLTIEIAKSAFAKGALLLNYAESKSFVYDESGKIIGAKILDKSTDKEFEIKAKVIVNACGPWVDLLRKEDNSLKGKRLQLTKGVHIVFPYEKLPLKQAAYFDVGDGRMIFAIPRNKITYVGTTDTVYNQDLDKPTCNKEDALYLLSAINTIFPSVKLKLEDIVSSWAGLRPLIYEEGKSASELSRKDEIMISPSGLISIAGGKLTGYRLMAAKIVNLAAKTLGKDFGSCKTKNFRLNGGEFENEESFKKSLGELLEKGKKENISAEKIKEWFFRYGTNTSSVLENFVSLKTKGETEHNASETAELLYCLENEMIFQLSDFLIRRTGKIFFDRKNSEKQIESLNHQLTQELNQSDSFSEKSVRAAKEEFLLAVTFS